MTCMVLFSSNCAQALAELESVRQQLRQPYAAKSTIEAAVSKLEAGLRMQTQVCVCVCVCLCVFVCVHVCMRARSRCF